ncbi:hypothetical protein A3D03_00140 [Candidatus Gottesmanbacteria bacterium RIFCSPHIGHO2_02_FULL_40_13]|uniref:DUF4012 domain-containing protein n=1 Tax=Candidatus Gottesmanbacteria bacterium RIFCSPHIGHO2_02_FULL_40_13 TaxID=1798384 RepID=A0A1F6ACP4_9BACT|nr:MAG: hypothetical protein A3D03_00140 [Candidatus Gottesmanbacteria bacterium RIFCSPHIGHO2_02_FULL_40_13]
MTQKKTIQIVGDDIFPQALIIGDNTLVQMLLEGLKIRGCDVKLAKSPQEVLTPDSPLRYDYIFQLGTSDNAIEIKRKLLSREGKFLLVELDSEFTDLGNKGRELKIFRAGKLSLWDGHDLTGRLYKAIFSRSSYGIEDERKVAVIKKDISPDLPKSGNVSLPKPFFPKQIVQKSVTRPERTLPRKKISRRGLGLIILFLVIISGISASAGWYFLSLKKSLSYLKIHLVRSDFGAVSEDVKDIKSKLDLARSIYNFSYTVLIPLRGVTTFQEMGELIDIGQSLTSSFRDSADFISEFKISRQSSVLPTSELNKNDIDQSINKVENLYGTLTDARGRAIRINIPYFPKKEFIDYLDGMIENLSSLRQVLPVFEKMFITDQAKIYLVLFQNNMELRPTGGFIGSFAILNVLKGKILNFDIIDVYTADGQLKGHVDPPLPIRKFLNQPNWFLRDSNFDPDFAASSLQAAWFLQKELGTSVDGVIGVNLFFVQNLLKVTGPLTLPDFPGEVISSDNFFFKAHYFAQNNFFPGSTQKKDFLNSAAKQMQFRLTNTQNISWFDLFTAIRKSLEEKNILLYSEDTDVQTDIENSAWGGRMIKVGCLAGDVNKARGSPDISDCYPDYLSVNEANLGVNKANYFVEKNITVEKRIADDGLITTTLTLSYDNKNIPEVFSDGTYKNYLRIFVPVGSRLLTATINTMPILSSDISVDEYNLDKTVFGMLVNIASANRGIIKLSYALPRLFTGDLSSYQFYFEKQSGDKTSPLLISIKPQGLQNVSPVNFKPTSQSAQEIFYATDTLVDRIFAFEVKK